jgi:methionyl-tRNA formyltransferase
MGLLPYFRGMNVLEWSIFYNRKIGVTVHFIDRGIDTGDILMFKEIPVESGDTIEDLRDKSGIINLELINSVILRLSRGTLQRIRQLSEEGKQFFVMHPRLKTLVENKLKNQVFLPL